MCAAVATAFVGHPDAAVGRDGDPGRLADVRVRSADRLQRRDVTRCAGSKTNDWAADSPDPDRPVFGGRDLDGLLATEAGVVPGQVNDRCRLAAGTRRET